MRDYKTGKTYFFIEKKLVNWYFKACVVCYDFIVWVSLLTWKPLHQGFMRVEFKSFFIQIHDNHHDLIIWKVCVTDDHVYVISVEATIVLISSKVICPIFSCLEVANSWVWTVYLPFHNTLPTSFLIIRVAFSFPSFFSLKFVLICFFLCILFFNGCVVGGSIDISLVYCPENGLFMSNCHTQ